MERMLRLKCVKPEDNAIESVWEDLIFEYDEEFSYKGRALNMIWDHKS